MTPPLFGYQNPSVFSNSHTQFFRETTGAVRNTTNPRGPTVRPFTRLPGNKEEKTFQLVLKQFLKIYFKKVVLKALEYLKHFLMCIVLTYFEVLIKNPN